MDNLWVILSFIVMFSTSFSLILLKLLTNTKLDVKILLTFSYIISALIGSIYILFNKAIFTHTISNMSFYIVLLIFFFAFFHICSQGFMSNAIKLSPNVSYCHLIVNLNVIITLIASYLLFKQKFNIKSFIGIIIAIIGTSIVIYYSNN